MAKIAELQALKELRNLTGMIKGLAAFEETLQEAGSLERLIANKQARLGELEAEIAARLEATDIEVGRCLAEAEATGKAVLAAARDEAAAAIAERDQRLDAIKREAAAAAAKLGYCHAQ